MDFQLTLTAAEATTAIYGVPTTWSYWLEPSAKSFAMTSPVAVTPPITSRCPLVLLALGAHNSARRFDRGAWG